MMAMKYGKHIYVEKPMCRTFHEGELLMQMARRHPELATQVGNQGHSEANYFQFKAWQEAGIIKDVTAVTAHMNNSRRWHRFDPNIKHLPEAEALPQGMDWDTWLGASTMARLFCQIPSGRVALVVRLRHGSPRRLGCSYP